MKEIFESRLFIGNREDAFLCLTEDTDITHILTIEAEPLSESSRYDKRNSEVVLKHVQCLDQLDADLLSHFDECIQFIEEGLHAGKVLVHCAAGVSRSATVILAYRMHSQNKTLDQALQDLKCIYPKADPNSGFMFQLHLFGSMGNKVDKSSPLYKQYNLKIIAKQVKETGYSILPKEMLKDTDTEIQDVNLKEKAYKCRKCRSKLFNSKNYLEHIPSTGDDFMSWKDNLTSNRGTKAKCSSYFIEPVPWMKSLLIVGNVEGKLSCPKCSARLGSFNWAGVQCSCGKWVTPAFQVHKSRIDES